MKHYVILALLCFTSSVLGSVTTVAFLPKAPELPEPVDPPEWAVPDELEVSKVIVVDPRGKARIVLAADLTPGGSGPIISFYDSFGVRKMTAGIDEADQPYFVMENSSLPNPEHKRITLSLTDTQARLEMGHGEISEILLQSARPADTSENRIQLRARNSSTTALYVDDYGRATVEVTDNATNSVFRIPERRQSVLD